VVLDGAAGSVLAVNLHNPPTSALKEVLDVAERVAVQSISSEKRPESTYAKFGASGAVAISVKCIYTVCMCVAMQDNDTKAQGHNHTNYACRHERTYLYVHTPHTRSHVLYVNDMALFCRRQEVQVYCS
jgi:hypothetical protein